MAQLASMRAATPPAVTELKVELEMKEAQLGLHRTRSQVRAPGALTDGTSTDSRPQELGEQEQTLLRRLSTSPAGHPPAEPAAPAGQVLLFRSPA